jgi:maltose/maltodextrin transport system substrate-binding protein
MKLERIEARRFIARALSVFGSLWLLKPVLAQATKTQLTQKPLVIWFTVEGSKGMRKVAEAFTKDTGVPVVVETPDEGPSKFQQAASAGKGPDIYIYAHDRIGEWVASGLIRSITPSKRIREDIAPIAWQGFTWRGRYWGYPYAIEAVTLVYNKALVSQAPTSFDDVFELDQQLRKQGKSAIVWDYTNTYFTWPLFAANGGFSFKQRTDGSVDTQIIGVANNGSIQGARLLHKLIADGVMQKGIGYPEMEAAMAQGKAAMMINGPWSWVNLKKAGIDFGVAKVPSVGGSSAKPFVGVKGLMINRSSPHPELAVEFIENYLFTLEGLRIVNQAEPIGAPASQAFFKELSIDSKLAVIMASANDGVPTPAVPEMGRFWDAMKSALLNFTQGRQSPEAALKDAERKMRDAN